MRGYSIDRRVGYLRVNKNIIVKGVLAVTLLVVSLIFMLVSYMNLRTDLIMYREDMIKLNQQYEDLSEEIKEKDKIIEEYREIMQTVKKRDRENLIVANRGGGRGRTVEKAKFQVTMYTNEEGWWEPGSPHWGTMTNGEKTHIGAVAAPISLPFGTHLAFKSVEDKEWEEFFNRLFVVKDRGGDIIEEYIDGEKVYCIDVYIGDKKLANKWGRRFVEGYIIKNR